MEKIIYLNKVDHKQELLGDAIGIPEQEFDNCLWEINNEPSLEIEVEIENLGFTEEEVKESLKRTRRLSEAVVLLWQRKRREEIAVREFLLTARLIKRVETKAKMHEMAGRLVNELINEILPEALIERTRQRIIKLVQKGGTPVLRGGKDCDMWLKDHEGSKGCPHELGCEKASLIGQIIVEMAHTRPESLENFPEIDQWMNIVIDGTSMILDILAAKTMDDLKKFNDRE